MPCHAGLHSICKVDVPALETLDLSSLSVQRKGSRREFAEMEVGLGVPSAPPTAAQGPSCGSPTLVGSVTAAQGATTSRHAPLQCAWSAKEGAHTVSVVA